MSEMCQLKLRWKKKNFRDSDRVVIEVQVALGNLCKPFQWFKEDTFMEAIAQLCCSCALVLKAECTQSFENLKSFRSHKKSANGKIVCFKQERAQYKRLGKIGFL